MRKTAFILLSIIVATSVSAFQLVIPAAGSGPGANNSQWQSDLTIHNVSTIPADIVLEYHDSEGMVATHSLSILSRQTVSLEDIVQSVFQKSGTGAIVITGNEFALRKLSVSSRTFNRSELGEFGQDIPAWSTPSAAAEGDTAVINGPLSPSSSRYNFGIYAIDATEVDWMLIREDGSSAATVSATYEAGAHVQYNRGIETFLGSDNLPNDVVYARIRAGRAFVYGSIVEDSSNDPSFVPFVATRENFAAQLLGVDLNEDGVIDIADENGDGVLDGEIRLSTIGFPNFFRVVVIDPEGSEVSIELIDASPDVRLFPDGTVQWSPSMMLRGTIGALKLRATDGFAATDFLIPVVFR